jgi:hypothetical protein
MTLFLGIGLSLMWVKYKIGYPTNLFFYFFKFKGPAKKHVACPLHDLILRRINKVLIRLSTSSVVLSLIRNDDDVLRRINKVLIRLSTSSVVLSLISEPE